MWNIYPQTCCCAEKIVDQVFEEVDQGQHVNNISAVFLEKVKNHRKVVTEKVLHRPNKKFNVDQGKVIPVEDLEPHINSDPQPCTSGTSWSQLPATKKESCT